MNPFFTVITSTLNVEDTILCCINSLKNQSFVNYEHIIIDGGSNDQTLSIIKDSRDHRVVVISEKDDGIYSAWNKGVKLARGKYISFLGADDYYVPDALECYYNNLYETNINYISSMVALDNIQGRVIGRAFDCKLMSQYMCVAHVGSFHSRSLFLDKFVFNESLKIVSDYEFLLRNMDEIIPKFVPKVTAVMGIHGVSHRKASLALKESLFVKNKYFINRYFINTGYFYYAYLKLLIRRLIFNY